MRTPANRILACLLQILYGSVGVPSLFKVCRQFSSTLFGLLAITSFQALANLPMQTHAPYLGDVIVQLENGARFSARSAPPRPQRAWPAFVRPSALRVRNLARLLENKPLSAPLPTAASVASLQARRKGILRRRWPVAVKMALASEGLIKAVSGSPMPPGFSLLLIMCTSITGDSFMRTTA